MEFIKTYSYNIENNNWKWNVIVVILWISDRQRKTTDITATSTFIASTAPDFID